LPNALKKLYPNEEWNESEFLSEKAKVFWKLRDNRRALLDSLGEQLGISEVCILETFIKRYSSNLSSYQIGIL